MHPHEPRENPYASPLDWWRRGATTGSDEAIAIEGEDNFKEFLRATFVSIRRLIRWTSVFFLVLALLAMAAKYVNWRRTGSGIGWDDVAVVVFALLGPGWISIAMVIFCKYLWRRGTRAQEPFRKVISAESISVTTPTLHVVMRWEAFRGYREGLDLVLVGSAHNAGQWFTFSRRHFSQDDWERFRQLVDAKLPEI